ncbi:Chromosome partition protein smc [Lachnospiraceae bacterium TWA4]|nr:Chromosome partition protein smc [Lachnospiraceae bacterium TWA4]
MQEQVDTYNQAKVIYIEGKSNFLVEQQKFSTILEQNSLRKTALEENLEELQNQKNQLEEEFNQLVKEQKSIEKDAQALLKRETLLKETSRQREEKEKIQNEELIEVNKQMEILSTRIETLETMAERYEGYGTSVKALMNERKNFKGIHGVVADLIKVEKNHETAIETALGASIQHIVTDNEYTARDCIEFLKKTKAGRATFLPISSIQRGSGFSNKEVLREKGVVAVASELVSTKKEYESIIYFLLGSILVVDTMNTAIKLSRLYGQSFRIVTLTGEQLHKGGSISGGAYKSTSHLLGRIKELEDLKNKKQILCEKEEEIEEQIRKLQGRNEELKVEFEELGYDKESLQEEQNAKHLEITAKKVSLESLAHQKQELLDEIDKISQTKEEMSRKQSQLEQQLKDFEDHQLEWKLNEEQLKSEIEELTSQMKRVTINVNELKLEQAKFLQKRI